MGASYAERWIIFEVFNNIFKTSQKDAKNFQPNFLCYWNTSWESGKECIKASEWLRNVASVITKIIEVTWQVTWQVKTIKADTESFIGVSDNEEINDNHREKLLLTARIYWNRILAASDLLGMFTQSINPLMTNVPII